MAMKLRLVKLGTGEYEVQMKNGFFDTWTRYNTYTKLQDAIEYFDCQVLYYTAKKNRQKIVEVLKQVTI